MQNLNSIAKTDRPNSRIEQDVNTVQMMTQRVEAVTERITRHARSLGYFEPPAPAQAGAMPMPVITTLADAIGALDRALEHCVGSLNVFD